MKYYPQTEIARVLNVSPCTIGRWLNQEEIDTLILPGGRRRLTEAHLKCLLRKKNIPLDYIDRMQPK